MTFPCSSVAAVGLVAGLAVLTLATASANAVDDLLNRLLYIRSLRAVA